MSKKLKLRHGEIATIVAIVGLVILGVTTLVSTVFLNNNRQTTNTKAATYTSCPAYHGALASGTCPDYQHNSLDLNCSLCATPSPEISVTTAPTSVAYTVCHAYYGLTDHGNCPAYDHNSIDPDCKSCAPTPVPVEYKTCPAYHGLTDKQNCPAYDHNSQDLSCASCAPTGTGSPQSTITPTTTESPTTSVSNPSCTEINCSNPYCSSVSVYKTGNVYYSSFEVCEKNGNNTSYLSEACGAAEVDFSVKEQCKEINCSNGISTVYKKGCFFYDKGNCPPKESNHMYTDLSDACAKATSATVTTPKIVVETPIPTVVAPSSSVPSAPIPSPTLSYKPTTIVSIHNETTCPYLYIPNGAFIMEGWDDVTVSITLGYANNKGI